jgi:hypothetical protein
VFVTVLAVAVGICWQLSATVSVFTIHDNQFLCLEILIAMVLDITISKIPKHLDHHELIL